MRRPLAVLLLIGGLLPIVNASSAQAARPPFPVLGVVGGPLHTQGHAVVLTLQVRRSEPVVAELQERVPGRGWVVRERHAEPDGRHRYRLTPSPGEHRYRVALRRAGRVVGVSTVRRVHLVPTPRIQVSASWAAPSYVGVSSTPSVGISTIEAHLSGTPAGGRVRLQRWSGSTWGDVATASYAHRAASFQLVGAPTLRTYRVVLDPTRHVDGAVSEVLAPTSDLPTPVVVDGDPVLAPAGSKGVLARFRVDAEAGQHLTFAGEDGQAGGWILYGPDGSQLALRRGDSFRKGLPATGTYTVERYAIRDTAEPLRVWSHTVIPTIVDGDPVIVPATVGDRSPVLSFTGVPGRFVTVRTDDPECLTAPGRLDEHRVAAYGDGRSANYLHDTRRAGTYHLTVACPTDAEVQVRTAPAFATLPVDGTSRAWEIPAAGQLAVVPLGPVATNRTVSFVVASSITATVSIIDLTTGIGTGPTTELGLQTGHSYVAVVRAAGDAVGTGTLTATPAG